MFDPGRAFFEKFLADWLKFFGRARHDGPVDLAGTIEIGYGLDERGQHLYGRAAGRQGERLGMNSGQVFSQNLIQAGQQEVNMVWPG